ncbi:MAG: hypothetical protein IH612_10300 [Desulfofustis sp.]|nr:hypothetical protein [Desulfofustis sp.]
MQAYAQINEEGICIGVSSLSGPVDKENLIPIDSQDVTLIGKRWDGAGWIDGPGQTVRVMSKYEFRKLLTGSQKLVWDNYDILKGSLGLTDMQYMMMRTFRADFDVANEVDLGDQLLIDGMYSAASWGLQLDGVPVFTTDDVTRILSGNPPQG